MICFTLIKSIIIHYYIIIIIITSFFLISLITKKKKQELKKGQIFLNIRYVLHSLNNLVLLGLLFYSNVSEIPRSILPLFVFQITRLFPSVFSLFSLEVFFFSFFFFFLIFFFIFFFIFFVQFFTFFFSFSSFSPPSLFSLPSPFSFFFTGQHPRRKRGQRNIPLHI